MADVILNPYKLCALLKANRAQKKIAIYLINAPFQMLSANQNIRGAGWLSVLVVRDNAGGGANKIPFEVKYAYKNYDLVINNSSSLRIVQALHTLAIALLFRLHGAKVSDLNLGESKSLFSRLWLLLFDIKSVSILDDGTATLNNYIFGNKGLTENPDSILRGLSYRKFYSTKCITLKTFLDVPETNGCLVKKYSFSDIPSRSDAQFKRYSDRIIFLGASFVEKEVMSESVYSKLCRSLVADSPLISVEYWRHRAESVERVKSMCIDSFFTVAESSLPIELALLLSESIPQKIITFQSAAVLTIAALFPSIEITLIRVDRNNFQSQNSNQRLFLSEMECYDHYLERYDFNTICV